ncbi:type II toxin-antitoxin system VapB family antitoxin [Streptomyces phytohabitans]|uniref:type II toxin-antitoxin system VapB family antitoxin n=1 Tax=Streptomyces phytohabitans TaxID=1150371 RepID=UPI00345C3F5C
MSRTVIGPDDDPVGRAADLPGTTTEPATVNGALGEFVAAAKRRQFLKLVDDGVFDDLTDDEVMAGARR